MSFSRLSLSLACLLATSTVACLPDRCKETSANIELEVTFSGFNTSNAKRIEFETEVIATSINDAVPNYYERRLGSITFPSLNDGQKTFVFDTGTYLNQLPEEQVGEEFRVTIRVYGQQGSEPDALLAEGQYVQGNISNQGCYIEKKVEVTGKSTCRNKVAGDPCVSPDSSHPHGVCKGTGTNLECSASFCGDDFTDRRAGEICDHPDMDACMDNCLPRPLSAEISDTIPTGEPDLNIRGGVKGRLGNGTALPGFWSMGVDETSQDLVGNLLVGDLDGDGVDEMLLSLPGGWLMPAESCLPQNEPCVDQKVGVSHMMDYPQVSDMSYGQPTNVKTNIVGPYSSTLDYGTWLGASSALGDVNGDGFKDLVLGAPHFRGAKPDAGAFYLFYGGAGGAIPPSPPNIIDVETSSASAYQLFTGEEGSVQQQPGDYLGYAIAIADFDLDGIADVAVAAPNRKDPAITSKGEVYILRGGDNMNPATAGQRPVFDEADLRIVVEASTMDHLRLGISLTTGDVDADGYPDLIMGTTSADASNHHGGIAVLFGGPDVYNRSTPTISAFPAPTGSERPRDLVALQVSSTSNLVGLGGTVQAVDINGDGYSDVAATLGRVGIGDNRATVALIDGRFLSAQRTANDAATEPGDADVTLITGPANAQFGLILNAVDVSGDRRKDLLISAPADSFDGRTAAGSVYALLATPLGQWWDPAGQTIDIATLRNSPNVDPDPMVPLLWLRGTTDEGRFGTSAAGSSHLSQWWWDVSTRDAYTYVFEAGYSYGGEPNTGRIWSLYVPALLPCELIYPCEDKEPAQQ